MNTWWLYLLASDDRRFDLETDTRLNRTSLDLRDTFAGDWKSYPFKALGKMVPSDEVRLVQYSARHLPDLKQTNTCLVYQMPESLYIMELGYKSWWRNSKKKAFHLVTNQHSYMFDIQDEDQPKLVWKKPIEGAEYSIAHDQDESPSVWGFMFSKGKYKLPAPILVTSFVNALCNVSPILNPNIDIYDETGDYIMYNLWLIYEYEGLTLSSVMSEGDPNRDTRHFYFLERTDKPDEIKMVCFMAAWRHCSPLY